MNPAKPTRPKLSKSQPQLQPSAFEKAVDDLRHQKTTYEDISPRWLLGAFGVVILAAIVFGWLALVLLYWQGNWQLLYHPQTVITRTPASVGLTYNTIPFAVSETGQPQLSGWWIPAPLIRSAPGAAPSPHRTVLYLHGADGDLSDTVDALPAFRNAGLATFAIDYRGYGQSATLSQAGHPSEEHLRQDAESALKWLVEERKVAPNSILVYGVGLGADIAAEIASAHPELAGVILQQPIQEPTAAIFQDSRSRLVPAHWLVKDSYDLTAAARSIKVPSLWLFGQSPIDAYEAVPANKTSVTLRVPILADPNYSTALKRWLDDLQS
jgi:acetyl esterase/lipase